MARRLRFQRLDRVQRDRLMAGIKAGESITALAEAFGVSRRTVYNYKARLEETELQYRSAVLTVRLNKPDLAGLDELAKKHGLSRAEAARAVLTRAVDVFQAEPRETEAILELTQQLHTVGGNLNQIARALNLAAAKGALTLDPATVAALKTVQQQGAEVVQFAAEARRVMVRGAQLQRTRNEAIFARLGDATAPERPAEAPVAPERPAEAPVAPERPAEAPVAPERPAEASSARARRWQSMLRLTGRAGLIIAAVALSTMIGTPNGSQAVAQNISSATPSLAETDVSVAAHAWVELLDNEQWDASWQASGTMFKTQLASTQWVAMVQSVRKPLGRVSTRTLKSVVQTNTLPGAPAGDYQVLQFQTHFANKPDATETVVLSREKAGWRVNGYFIR
jgi:hypothetical protein